MGAPVCHIEPQVVINDLNQPAGVTLPSIPIATDMASALAAVNAMRHILNFLLNQQGRNVTGGGTGPRGAQGTAGKSPKPPKPGKYVEDLSQRVVKKVVVHSSEDPDTTLTFKRIERMKFNDTMTKEPWSWVRGESTD